MSNGMRRAHLSVLQCSPRQRRSGSTMQSIFHVSFPVTSLQASIVFYTEVLGAAPGRTRPEWADVILLGHQITLHQQPDEVLPREGQGVRHFGVLLHATDWRALVQRVQQRAPQCIEALRGFAEGQPAEHAKLLLRDPDGHLVELKTYRDPSTVSDALAAPDTGMRKLGLIGGMSWESTLPYYRLINEYTRQRRGGLHSAPLLLESVDFAPIAAMQKAGDWDRAGQLLAACAGRLEAAGAEALVLCTNTMHKLAPQIEAAVSIPLLHIVDATAAAIKQAGLRDIALLGTAFTMEQPFYAERMGERHGLRIHIPDAEDRAEVHRIIYEELCLGEIRETSRRRYREVIARLVDRGAQGLIMGCTEIGLLISQADSAVPVFDSTALHAEAAVGWALDPGSGPR